LFIVFPREVVLVYLTGGKSVFENVPQVRKNLTSFTA